MHWDEPGISVQMYSVAISLIESFDTMEEKDQRSGGHRDSCSKRLVLATVFP